MESNADQSLNRTSLTAKLRPRQALSAVNFSWLGNLRVGQKLTLIAVAFGIPVTVLLSLLVQEQQQGIRRAQKELVGAAYLAPMNDVVREIGEYTAATVSERLGNWDGAGEREEAGKRINELFETLEAQAARNSSMNVEADLHNLHEAFEAFSQKLPLLEPEDIIAQYDGLTQGPVNDTITQISTKSSLTQDPDTDSYWTADVAVRVLPTLSNLIGKTQIMANSAFTMGELTPQARDTLAADMVRTQDAVQQVMRSVNFAVAANPKLGDTIGLRAQEMKSLMDVYVNEMRGIATNRKLPEKELELQSLNEAIAESLVALRTEAQSDLSRLVEARSDRLQRNRLIALLGVGTILLLAFWLLAAIVRAITRPLTQLTEAAQAIGRGDLSVNVTANTTDEIGIVSQTFNDAVEQLREVERRNAEEREAAQELQHNIAAFLDVTMDIAEGDLTKRGRVTEDVLGNVVDSINLMVEELESVLRSVHGASASVTDSAASMLDTTDRIVQGTETTAAASQQVAREVQNVTASIREMVENAQASAQTAQLAMTASQQGQQAVESTLAGMQNIRREVQGISKRIKGLGDRSLEIQEIVDTISRITRQTNLLALNAAIEAAGAGEAGSRFAVVADEVRKLADSSAQATGRIATLIKNVQAEVQEVIASVEDGTREVEAGYRVAGTAGERLAEIAQLAQRSAELAFTISYATRAQVQGVEQVGDAVSSIADVADQSRETVRTGREAAERLRELADNLTEQLSRFRLSS